MANGILRQDRKLDFEKIFSHIGRMFVQGMEIANEDHEASWHSLHSRLMMTDPSQTMARNDEDAMKAA